MEAVLEAPAVDEPLDGSTFPMEAEQSPPELPPAPAADEPDYVRQHYDAILEKERSVRVLEDDYLAVKEEAAAAKKSFEAADKALRMLIARGPDPQRSLPFAEPAPEAWRAAALSELALPDGLHNLLCAAGVETIGQLEDLRAKIADGKAEWPKGIGEARITDLENKVVDWLTANRDKFGEAVEAEIPATIITPDDVANEESALLEASEDLLERAGLADKVQRSVTVSSNGHAKAKKRGFAGRPAKKSKAKKGRK
jgi:hypothetical protein